MLDREYLEGPLALAGDLVLAEGHERRQPQVGQHGVHIHPAPACLRRARHAADPLTNCSPVGFVQDRTHLHTLLHPLLPIVQSSE